MSDFYLILKNLSRNKLRFGLNTFAIFVAFFLFGMLGSINKAFNAGIDLAAENRLVVVNKINFTQPLPIHYVSKIKAIEGVDLVTHANWFGAYVKDSKHQFAGFAVDPNSYLDVYSDLFELDETKKRAWISNRQGVVVGERLAKVYGWQEGDRIPISSNIFSKEDGSSLWDMKIEGIFKSKEQQGDTNLLLFHYKYFIETQTFGDGWIGWVTLTTQDASLNEAVVKRIDDNFKSSNAETKTTSEKQFNKSFIEQIGSIGAMITAVVAAAFFTILLIVGNSMLLAVKERTREIGVLKTLGFSAQRIFKIILGESFFLALLGGSLGLLFSWFMTQGMSQSPQLSNVLPNLNFDMNIAITAVIYMLCLGLVTGFLPAFRAMKLNIVDAISRG